MRKLKLELDGLQVESFDTQPGARGAGTVAGHADLIGIGNVVIGPAPDTQDLQRCWESWNNSCVTCVISACPGETCGNQLTCGNTCKETCEACTYRTCPSGVMQCCV